MYAKVISSGLWGTEGYLATVEVDIAKTMPGFDMVGMLAKEVKEARYKSGTLITVDAALEQGKEVMALPGRVNDSLSQGCNMLIGQGAVMLKEPEVFREELFNLMGISKGKEDEGEVFSQKEKMLLQVLEDTPLSLNEIWERVQNCNEDEKGVKIEGVTELTTILMELCVRKKIVVWQGNYRKTL